MLPHEQLLLRIAVGTVLGGLIGLERDFHGRPAGLRTHLLVALASATFMVVSIQFAFVQPFTPGGVVVVEASRIAGAVVSAVGFLAGGAILRSGMSVKGMTTAAGLWLVTAIGLCAGAGMYVEAVFSTLVGLFALSVLRRFEGKDDDAAEHHVSLTLRGRGESVASLSDALASLGIKLDHVEVDRRLGEVEETQLSFDLTRARSLALDRLVEALSARPGVLRVRVASARAVTGSSDIR